MADKLVKSLDNEIWTKFTGWCKANQIRVGVKLSEILHEFIKKRVRP